jgi:hypothetical protein
MLNRDLQSAILGIVGDQKANKTFTGIISTTTDPSLIKDAIKNEAYDAVTLNDILPKLDAEPCHDLVAKPTKKITDESEARSIINNWMTTHGIDKYQIGDHLLDPGKLGSPSSRVKNARKMIKSVGDAVISIIPEVMGEGKNYFGFVRYAKKTRVTVAGTQFPRAYPILYDFLTTKKNLVYKSALVMIMTEHAMTRILQHEKPSTLRHLNTFISPYVALLTHYTGFQDLPSTDFLLLGEDGYFPMAIPETLSSKPPIPIASTFVSAKTWTNNQREYYRQYTGRRDGKTIVVLPVCQKYKETT